MRRLLLLLITLVPLSTLATGNTIIVKPTTLQTQEFFNKYSAYGECKNEMSRNYYSFVDGTVDFLLTEQGRDVRAGETIMILNKEVADAIKSQNDVTFKTAKLSYDRDRALFKKQLISMGAMEKSHTVFEEAKAKFTQNIKTYNDMVITAPYDAKIGVIKAMVGSRVKMHDYLFTLVQDGKSSIFLELPETLLSKVSTATEVILDDINGVEFKGNVEATSSHLSSNGTITIKIATSGKSCTHGSYVNTHLIIDKHNSLAAPERSLLQNNEGSFVYKINTDNTISQICVKIGMRSNGMVEIMSDSLHENDMIVLEGLTKVSDGIKIEILR